MVGNENQAITIVNPAKNTAAIIFENLPRIVWAALACVFLYMFHSQISNVFNDLSTREGASVEVAGFKITMPKNAIPVASESVKTVLPKLDEDVIQSVIGTPAKNNRMDFCWRQQAPEELKDTSPLPKMLKAGLLSSLGDKVIIDGKVCESGVQILYNPLYYDIRNYLMSVIKGLNFNSK